MMALKGWLGSSDSPSPALPPRQSRALTASSEDFAASRGEALSSERLRVFAQGHTAAWAAQDSTCGRQVAAVLTMSGIWSSPSSLPSVVLGLFPPFEEGVREQATEEIKEAGLQVDLRRAQGPEHRPHGRAGTRPGSGGKSEGRPERPAGPSLTCPHFPCRGSFRYYRTGGRGGRNGTGPDGPARSHTSARGGRSRTDPLGRGVPWTGLCADAWMSGPRWAWVPPA